MAGMFCHLIGTAVASFKTRRALTLENLALRQQIAILERARKRPRFRLFDRLFWVILSRCCPRWREFLHIVTPDTVVRWHREGFRRYWARVSRRGRLGRPPIDPNIRKLIREMQSMNVGWGAPRIHGELLKLGIKIAEATVSKASSQNNLIF